MAEIAQVQPDKTPAQATKDFVNNIKSSMEEVRQAQIAEANKKGLPMDVDAAAKANGERIAAEQAAAASAATEAAKTVKPVKAADMTAEEKESVRKDIAEGKFPRSAVEWNKYKAVKEEDILTAQKERDEYKVKVTEYETKLKDVPQAPADYEQIKKDREEFSKRLRIADIKNHPEFQAKFDGAVSQQINLAKSIVGKDNADKIEKLLSLPQSEHKDKMIEDLVESLPVLQQSRIGAVINNLDSINAEKQQTIERVLAEANDVKEFETKRQQATVEGQKRQINAVLESYLTDAQKNNPAFQLKEGDAAWNGEVASRIEGVKNLINGKASIPQMIETTIKATAYDYQAAQLEASRAEIARLNESIAKFKGASPSVVTRTETAATANADGSQQIVLSKDMNPHDAAKAWAAGVNSQTQSFRPATR